MWRRGRRRKRLGIERNKAREIESTPFISFSTLVPSLLISFLFSALAPSRLSPPASTIGASPFGRYQRRIVPVWLDARRGRAGPGRDGTGRDGTGRDGAGAGRGRAGAGRDGAASAAASDGGEWWLAAGQGAAPADTGLTRRRSTPSDCSAPAVTPGQRRASRRGNGDDGE